MSDKDTMKDYLAKHPRMIGVLFTLFVLLSQAGTVVAGTNSQMGP
ncbi:DUF7503 family protein [Natrarchaeobius oligotrophus]|nr:hypothetical protein [Natrarchaeobius chitinivorans]